MENLITKFFTKEQFSTANEGVDNLLALTSPYSTSLNDEERIGIRTMKTDREGYARMISRIANVHENCLPRMEEPAKMDGALEYFDQLVEFRVKVAHLLEMIDDTSTALGIDIMGYADRYAGYLQTARKANISLDAAMDQVDEFNKRFANKSPGEDETPVPPPAN